MNTHLLRCCLLALTFLAAARAEDVVSNLANASTGQIALEDGGSSAAQAFTTGTAAVALKSIAVRLRSPLAVNSTARVKLWSGSGTVPGTLVEDLGTISGIVSSNDFDYSIASTTQFMLLPNTRYWVSVTNESGDFEWRDTSAAAFTGTGALVNARADSPSGAAASWSAYAPAANFQIFTVTGIDPFLVTRDNGSGPGTLRRAIGNAATLPGHDTITFDPAFFTSGLTIAPGIEFSINHDVTIDASNLDFAPNINGGGGQRIFVVGPNATLIVHGLKLSGGKAGVDGGAISNSGTLTLTRCTLTGNHADAGNGGAIFNNGTATLTQCTLSGNSASSSGGAIHNDGGTLTLTHCTLSGNTAPDGFGSGVASAGDANTETQVQNCIISANTNSNVDFVFGATNTFTSLGHNLIGSGNATGGFTVVGDILDNDPKLAALANNGGPTQTFALLPTSPARNAAAVLNPPITTDQRGFPIAGLPDIGAYEFPNTPPSAPNGTATATTGDQKTITLPASDVDGIAPTLTATTPDAHLTVNSTSGLDVTFTPATNYVGDATLGYTVDDGNNGTASGTITVTISDNDVPAISAPMGGFMPLMVYAGTMPDYRDQAVTTDNIGVTSVTQNPMQGSTTTVGDVSVTLTAHDAAGNATDTMLTVTIRPASAVSTVVLAKGAPAPGRLVSADLPDDAVIASFSTPATDDDGNLACIAKWTSVSGPVKRGTGLFLNDTCLAIVGGDASAIGGAGAKWRNFSDPVVGNGHAACIAKLSNGKTAVVCNLTGAALQMIALSGDAGTGDGAKFRSFKSVTVVGDQVAFLATLAAGTGTTPRTTAANDMGLWNTGNVIVGFSTTALALREGDAAGGKTIKTLVSFAPGNGSPGCGRGTFIVPTDGGDPQFGALAKFTDRTQGVIFQDVDVDVDDFTLLSLSGDAATGVDNGATFASYGPPALNRDETTAFLARLTLGAGVTRADASGIFTGPDGGGKFATIARAGNAAGATGANFRVLKDPVLAADGGLAFPATISARGLAKNTLWWQPPGGAPGLLAQGGAPATELTGLNWKAFTSLAIATERGPIFTATLTPRGSGAWANDFTGALRLLFNTGATVGGKTVKSFKLLTATTGATGVTRSYNDAAQVVWLATFTDKTTAIVVTEVP